MRYITMFGSMWQDTYIRLPALRWNMSRSRFLLLLLLMPYLSTLLSKYLRLQLEKWCEALIGKRIACLSKYNVTHHTHICVCVLVVPMYIKNIIGRYLSIPVRVVKRSRARVLHFNVCVSIYKAACCLDGYSWFAEARLPHVRQYNMAWHCAVSNKIGYA